MYSKTFTKPQAKIHSSSLTMMLKGQACNQSSNIITKQFSYWSVKVILTYPPKNKIILPGRTASRKYMLSSMNCNLLYNWLNGKFINLSIYQSFIDFLPIHIVTSFFRMTNVFLNRRLQAEPMNIDETYHWALTWVSRKSELLAVTCAARHNHSSH